MPSPTISVIIPSLNDSEYILQALESVLEQTYSDFEVVVVDDGSTDGTIKLIEGFEDERIRLIIRKDSSGITSALNRGIQEANGEYIARHDADDWSDPERFKKQLAYLNANPDVALVGTGAYLVDEQSDVQSRRRVLESPSFDDLIEHNEFVHGSVIARREALEEVDGYDEWFESTEDYDLWLRLADEYEVRNIDEPLYYFRQHDESLYGSNLEELKLYHLLAVRKVTSGIDDETRSLIDDQGIDVFRELLTDEEERWFHTELARENLRYGNMRSGRRHSKQAIKRDPTNPLVYLLLALSMTTPGIAKFAARTYRKLRNGLLALQN